MRPITPPRSPTFLLTRQACEHGLILQFEETNPEVVMAYRKGRKITDTGSTPKPPAPPTP